MSFSITYTIGRLPFTEIVNCTTVGELCMAIELVMLENDLFRSQITVHELCT
jgi:hypothetical protein